MKLVSEKFSTYLSERKEKNLKRKIKVLKCLADDLRKEAKHDPDRTAEYNDSIEQVEAQVGTITGELKILDRASQKTS